MNLHVPDPPAAPVRKRPQNICHSLLVVDRCFPARRDSLAPPPYPRYPLREFTPCAPGRSIPSCQEANPTHHRRSPPHRDPLWHPRLPPCEQKNAFHHNDTKTRRVFNYLTTSLRSFASFAVSNLFPALPGSGFQVPSRCAGTSAIQYSLFRNTLPPPRLPPCELKCFSPPRLKETNRRLSLECAEL